MRKQKFRTWFQCCLLTVLLAGIGIMLLPGLGLAAYLTQFCEGKQPCAGKNPIVKNIRSLQVGGRPRFSPDGKTLVFDRFNMSDNFYDVYVTDLQGNIITDITENKSGINQRNNGNAIYHPSGKYIIFLSEESTHAGSETSAGLGLTDPGLGFFSNFWAADTMGNQFWKLTNVPAKQNWFDAIPVRAEVNPVFSPDGNIFVWTERYDDGGNNHWGKWRLKAADFVVDNNVPALTNERVLYTPAQGNYVTAMDFIDMQHLIIAGNVSGQHEYGMDNYILNLSTGQLNDLANTPLSWEEGSAATPDKRVIMMSNKDSQYQLDFSKDWSTQKVQRDYYAVNPANPGKMERLTYFNDPQAPEYLGRDVIATSLDVNPAGTLMAGMLGVNYGSGTTTLNRLEVVLLDLALPSIAVGPADFNADGVVDEQDYKILCLWWFKLDNQHDLNGDGIINSIDFSLLNRGWKK